MGMLDWLFGTKSKPQQPTRAAPLQSVSRSAPATPPGPVSPPMPARAPAAPRISLVGVPVEVASWVSKARRARASVDIATARMCYQKAAYGFAQLTPDQIEQLKQEVAGFVRTDPLYAEGFAAVRTAVTATPGLLQSDLGKAAGENRDALNYVLYYAAVTGDLVRIKAGRSYQLYLPGQPIPPHEPKKPKQARKPAWVRKRSDYWCRACEIGTSRPLGAPAPACDGCGQPMACADESCSHPARSRVVSITDKVPPVAEALECYCLGCRRYLQRNLTRA